MAKSFQKDTNGTLTTGLVSYYKLGDTYDFYGSNNLTNNGTATFGAGKVNNGVDLEDSSDQFLSTTSTLGINGGNYSVSGWFKFESTPGNNAVMAMTYQCNNTSKTEYLLQYYNDAGTLKLWFDRAKPGVGDQYVTYSTTLSTGTFYHVVMTYDGTNLKGYLNGSEVATVAASGNGSSNGTEGFKIGQRYAETTTTFDGVIDEVGIWSKALSTTEISDLYNGGNGQTMTEPAGPANLKSFNGLAKASIKSINGTAIGSIKSLNGLS